MDGLSKQLPSPGIWVCLQYAQDFLLRQAFVLFSIPGVWKWIKRCTVTRSLNSITSIFILLPYLLLGSFCDGPFPSIAPWLCVSKVLRSHVPFLFLSKTNSFWNVWFSFFFRFSAAARLTSGSAQSFHCRLHTSPGWGPGSRRNALVFYFFGSF